MGFESLLGNERLKDNLITSLRRGRHSHFYLIAGPQGSGKHTLAKLLAAAIECQDAGRPCLRCSTCRKVMGPENAAQASILLSNMDLSGIGLLREQVEALAKAKCPASPDAAAASAPSDTKEQVKDPLLYAFEKAQQLREQAAEGAEP